MFGRYCVTNSFVGNVNYNCHMGNSVNERNKRWKFQYINIRCTCMLDSFALYLLAPWLGKICKYL